MTWYVSSATGIAAEFHHSLLKAPELYMLCLQYVVKTFICYENELVYDGAACLLHTSLI